MKGKREELIEGEGLKSKNEGEVCMNNERKKKVDLMNGGRKEKKGNVIKMIVGKRKGRIMNGLREREK